MRFVSIVVPLALLAACGDDRAQHEAPTTSTAQSWAKASGCNDFLIYAFNADMQRAINIIGSRAMLGLKVVGQSKTFNARGASASEQDGNHFQALWLARFKVPVGNVPFCSGAGTPYPPADDWEATGGAVTFTLTSFDGDDKPFALSVDLHGVTFRNNSGATELMPDVSFTNVLVGLPSL